MNLHWRSYVLGGDVSGDKRWCTLNRNALRQAGRSGKAGWLTRAAVAIVVAASATAAVTVAGAGVAGAQAGQRAAADSSKSAVVVKERNRPHFGKILVTTKGRALYYLPTGSCTGSCLGIWPRLVMPKGKTVPKGAHCLGTAKFGSNHRLQVTYHGRRLYTFIDDSGTGVTGNGVSGFKVAKVRACM